MRSKDNTLVEEDLKGEDEEDEEELVKDVERLSITIMDRKDTWQETVRT